ncbi:Uncharacterized oxidoreductase At4g09670 [Linum perenne]
MILDYNHPTNHIYFEPPTIQPPDEFRSHKPIGSRQIPGENKAAVSNSRFCHHHGTISKPFFFQRNPQFTFPHLIKKQISQTHLTNSKYNLKTSSDQQPKIRFGIISSTDIARKLAREITLSPKFYLSAVASRTLKKATAFAEENNLSPEVKIYRSYESLLENPEIEVVYIPLPTSLHLKWATLAAQKKKHVLLENPL